MMKKILLTFALLLVLLGNSQTTEYGIKGGLNMSDLIGDTENTDYYYSFHLGFFTEFEITEKLSIQPEIQYSSQGTNYNSNSSELEIDGELRFQYLNLPVMVKFDVFKGFFVEAGPQIGYLAYSKQVINHKEKENGQTIVHSSSRQNLRDFTNEIDYGATVGLGYQFKDGMFLEARYYHGLNDVIKDVEKNKNSVFQFSIGYRFQ